MKTKALKKFLQTIDDSGEWLFTTDQAAAYFRYKNLHALRKSLYRHEKARRFFKIHKGLYAHHYARSAPRFKLDTLVNHLREGEFNYVSLESRLSSLGVISQVPMVKTVSTTGRSGRYDTPYGSIDYTHTDIPREQLLEETVPDEHYGVHLATPLRAYLDLRHTNRNMGLIDNEELLESLSEWGQLELWRKTGIQVKIEPDDRIK